MKGTEQCDAGDDEGSPAEECDGWLLPQPGPDLLLKDWQELKAGAGTAGRRAEDPGLGAGKEVDRANQFPEGLQQTGRPPSPWKGLKGTRFTGRVLREPACVKSVWLFLGRQGIRWPRRPQWYQVPLGDRGVCPGRPAHAFGFSLDAL